MNNINLIGRTTRKPELKNIPSTGKAVTNFTLAVDKGLSKEMKTQFESEGKPTADFINVVVWGKLAEVVVNYVGKGKQVGVSGRLEINNYEKDGEKKSFTQVVGYNIDILEWSTNSKEGKTVNDDKYTEEDVFEVVDEDEIPFK